ncbi:hypothetical protein [Amycolatopsis sp. NPDC051371]|uniref:hypothetical protein n=1 Tax=Amycolatopsis sp. NPDC051371 TaxID=3155800 RepID=UPI0034414ED8
MSGDEVRRPRPIGQLPVPPGALSNLKAHIYELYLAAGAPSLDTMTEWVAADDDLAGAPARDTIRRIIRDPVTPPSQADVVAVVSVLATAAGRDTGQAANAVRDLWVAARLEVTPGIPLEEVRDPFELEVHRPIVLGEVTGLPPYVRRAHDYHLAEVVERAKAGVSAAVVLVGGSSAGKTRACWEALQPLRDVDGWRLWHPYDPTRGEAALAGLDRVGPRTVVWLNETQEYLKDHSERIAAKLRTLLAASSRAPVLVLGTLWPEHHAALTQTPGTQVRQVLEDVVVPVPEFFAGADFAAMTAAARKDTRLAWAIEHADDGQITQYLAGAPELLVRFDTAPAPAKALLWAAMDLRRFGHREALPQSLLEHAALAHLTRAQQAVLAPDWLERALAYTARPAKGALGPLTRVVTESTPMYRLADYLDQIGRTLRAESIPAIAFWRAVSVHAHPGDLNTIGQAAADRGLLAAAAQLRKNAVVAGYPQEAQKLLSPGRSDDIESAEWLAHHCPLKDPAVLRSVVSALHSGGFDRQLAALLARNPAISVDVDATEEVVGLLGVLHKVCAAEQVVGLAGRAAALCPVDSLLGAGHLGHWLNEVGASGDVDLLQRRIVADSPLTDTHSVLGLLEHLRNSGEVELTAALLARDPAAQVDVENFDGVGPLVLWFHTAGATGQAASLASRAAAQAPLLRVSMVIYLMSCLRSIGAVEEFDVLAERIVHIPLTPMFIFVAAYYPVILQQAGAVDLANALASRLASDVPLTDSFQIEYVLRHFQDIGASEHARRLAVRAAQGLVFDSFKSPSITDLVRKLRETGNDDQVDVLLARAVAEIRLHNTAGVNELLRCLHNTHATGHATALLTRDPATHATLDNPLTVARLLEQLHRMGATLQLEVMAARVGDVSPSSVSGVADLLLCLRRLKLEQPLASLTERAARWIPLDNFDELSKLLQEVSGTGTTEQLEALTARVAEMLPCFRETKDMVRVLAQLRTIGATGHAAALAGRIIAEIPDHETAASLVYELNDIGAADLVRKVVARVDRLPLGKLGRYSPSLVRALETVEAVEERAALMNLFPAVGAFSWFKQWDDHADRFRFGREPDGRPTSPWGWDDLG